MKITQFCFELVQCILSFKKKGGKIRHSTQKNRKMFNFLKMKKSQKERLKQVIAKDRKETEKENKIKQKTKK